MTRRFLSCCALALLLSGCLGPTPKDAMLPPGLVLPGSSGTDPTLTILPGTSSVAIDAVTGLPDGFAPNLRQALVDAFAREEMPAALDAANRASTRLRATAKLLPLSAREQDLVLSWDIRLPGQTVPLHAEQHEPIPAGREPTPPHWADIARRAVAALLPALRPAMPVEQPPAPIAIWDIDGAPGDGATSLRRAMEQMLRQNDRTLTTAQDSRALQLLCQISITPAANRQEKVAIRWTLLRPDGAEIGQIAQDNVIPAGSLNGRWGDIANAIAETAWDGLAPLLDRAREAATVR